MANDSVNAEKNIGDTSADLKTEQGWQPIETAPKMRKLIVGYANALGKWRTILAQYWLDGELESETDDSGFAPEGWYEATEAYEYLMPVDLEPTHWMPLPDPPEANV